jgi:hypothetical protein
MLNIAMLKSVSRALCLERTSKKAADLLLHLWGEQQREIRVHLSGATRLDGGGID